MLRLIIILLLISIQLPAQVSIDTLVSDLATINQRDENNRKQGVWYSYDKEKRWVYDIERYRNDTLHGSFESYWETTGKLYSTGFYKNGKLDSLFHSYWEDGQILCTGSYKNDLSNGVFKTYSPTGELTTEALYIDGKLDSTIYKDPTIATDNFTTFDTLYTASLNKEYEKYTIYRNDALYQMYNLKKGKKVNESFYKNGKETKRIIYCTKEPDSLKKIFYYKNGKHTKTELINPKCKKKKKLKTSPKFFYY